jgi:hypothetical protein
MVLVNRYDDHSEVLCFFPKDNQVNHLWVDDKSYTLTSAKLSQVESVANRVTEIDETADDEHYPTAKAVYDALQMEKVYYYTAFISAVIDVNALTTENADATKETAVCSLHTDKNGNKFLTLLSDIEITEQMTFSVPLTLNLNGYTISIPGDYKITVNTDNFVIDGRATGSKIIKNTDTNTKSLMFQFTGDNCKIIGGYFGFSAPATEKMVACFALSSGLLVIDNAEIHTEATAGTKAIYCVISNWNVKVSNSICESTSSDGVCVGIASQKNSLDVKNTTVSISATSKEGVGIVIQPTCIALIENCNLFADGTAGSVGDGYAGTQGIQNSGTAELKNCTVYGTHSGLQCNDGSNTNIDGGLYEGVGHGGVYIINSNKFYAENATFRNAPYRGKQKAKFNYANTQYMVAAVYIGGGNDIKAYFDNCILDGSGPVAVPEGDSFLGGEPIRLRASSGEQNNAAYISNCTLMGDGKITFSNATHKLHYGFCNRFLCEANNPSCLIDEGRVVYTGYEKFVEG